MHLVARVQRQQLDEDLGFLPRPAVLLDGLAVNQDAKPAQEVDFEFRHVTGSIQYRLGAGHVLRLIPMPLV